MAVHRIRVFTGAERRDRNPDGRRDPRVMKLLLIEDNPAMQTTLQRAFARRGLHVVACTDGARALDRWQASLPDIVVLDLSLPGRDGLDVLAAARAVGLATPVLILTARGTVGDRVLGLDTGADDDLAKPFDRWRAWPRCWHIRSASCATPCTSCARPWRC